MNRQWANGHAFVSLNLKFTFIGLQINFYLLFLIFALIENFRNCIFSFVSATYVDVSLILTLALNGWLLTYDMNDCKLSLYFFYFLHGHIT